MLSNAAQNTSLLRGAAEGEQWVRDFLKKGGTWFDERAERALDYVTHQGLPAHRGNAAAALRIMRVALQEASGSDSGAASSVWGAGGGASSSSGPVHQQQHRHHRQHGFDSLVDSADSGWSN